jgi:hypothetical protein
MNLMRRCGLLMGDRGENLSNDLPLGDEAAIGTIQRLECFKAE